MSIEVRSGTLVGVEGVPVQVEVDMLSLLPSFTVVGLPNSSIRESRERVRSAIGATAVRFPRRRITVNLAPADLPKHGSGLDLPIALGVMGCQWAEDKKKDPWPEPPFAIGELGLDGAVRPVRGILGIVEAAVRAGVTAVIVPRANAQEASLVPGVVVLHVVHLCEAWSLVRGESVDLPAIAPRRPSTYDEPDLHDVRGLRSGRRCLEIAAAGGHGLLLEGPPGSGKSMLAKRLASLLPDLPDEHALQVTRIHSAAGLLGERGALVHRPPLRAPHHTASAAAVIGGGSPVGPGEVTLAHRGVLLLDEVAEFPRTVLECLRQPLEDGSVTVARARQTVTFPAAFQLVATRNPCPCGLYGADGGGCTCLITERERYSRRVSGPLMDRIDLVAWIRAVPVADLLQPADGRCSADVRAAVEDVRALQAARWRGHSTSPHNAGAPVDGCLRLFDRPGRFELDAALRTIRSSSRGVQQLVRVATTVADLAGADSVGGEHVQEAALLCAGDRGWSTTQGRIAPPPRRDDRCTTPT